ncbi:MAG: DUF2877 domain-containing protein [Telmatospirillum sp.]|nr:DUF2877 domain-containing protein [Telmatospirillum sp.]
MDNGKTIILAGAAGAEVRLGRVIAAFKRSFYVADANGRIACAGGTDLGAGPLNILYAACPPIPAAGAAWNFELERVPIWRPEPWPPFNAPAARRAIAELPRDKGLLVPADGDPFRAAAQAPLAALANWQGGPVPPILENLLGLGPGLTPAGDDALGGAALALRAVGRTPDADALRAFLHGRMPTATSAISAAHLSAALDGAGAQALHKILADIVQGQTPDLGPLDAIGHSSGFDALAGIVAVLA